MILSKYTTVFKNAWQIQLSYRLDFISRFVVAFVSLVSVFYLWNDIFIGKRVIVGYTHPEIITYYIMVVFLYASIYINVPIAEDIQTGQLSQWITKPINYLFYQYWHTLARRIFRVVVWTPLMIVFFLLVRSDVFLVLNIWSYLLMVLVAFSAINMLFLFDVLVSAIEFWVFGSSSITLVTDMLIAFFSGTLIPLVFLPDYVNIIGNFLPFKYTVNFIVNTFMGRLSALQVLSGLGMQLAWTLFLLVIVSVVWWRGLVKYEAVGA